MLVRAAEPWYETSPAAFAGSLCLIHCGVGFRQNSIHPKRIPQLAAQVWTVVFGEVGLLCFRRTGYLSDHVHHMYNFGQLVEPVLLLCAYTGHSE